MRGQRLSQDKRLHFKLCILGDGGVGKTTLIHRFLSGAYLSDLKMTIGVDFHIHKRDYNEYSITFQIWDLGGQERFQRMGVFDRYVTGSHAALLAFDLSQLDSFENLHKWLDIAKSPESSPLIALVGTKHDLVREVDNDLIDTWNKENGVSHFIETSAVTGENINELFDFVCSELISKYGHSD